jgi:Flp pilus assembly protein TadD
VVLLGAAAVIAYLRFGPSRLEEEAYDAIARGDLVTPVRVSAYDYAQRLALQRPGSGAAERVGQRAFPELIRAIDDLYARFYATSEASRADWERTARLAAWATEIAPDDAHVRARAAYAEARLAALSGDPGAARAGYEAAAEAWPEWALPPNSLGRVLADARQTAAAEAQYRTAARLDPEWPFPLSNLGTLYLREERYADAADVLARAVRLDPARAFTHALLARALAGQGQYAEAAAEARDALARDPAGTAGFDAAALRRDIGQWDLLAQGVVDWDGDGVVEPEAEMADTSGYYESDDY